MSLLVLTSILNSKVIIKSKRIFRTVILLIITMCIFNLTPAKADNALEIKYIAGPFDSSINIDECLDGGVTTFYKHDSGKISGDYGIIDKKGREIVNA